jgi:hypothetical protein
MLADPIRRFLGRPLSAEWWEAIVMLASPAFPSDIGFGRLDGLSDTCYGLPGGGAEMTFGDDYLIHPLTFGELPAEPWGFESLAVDLAGGSYRFSSLAPAQAEWVRARFQSLCDTVSGAAAPVRTTVHRLPESAFREIDTRGWEYTFDRDYRPECLRLAGRDLLAEVYFKPDLRSRLWTSRIDPERFPGVFENFFRVLVAYRVAHSGGVLLHSAAFARDGRAQVVFGRSGAGKSTSARLALAAGWELLSDDMNALLPDPGGWRVEKLPFAGDLGQTPTCGRVYPIAGLYWLHQASAHAVRPMSRSLALARLLACAPVVNEDPFRVDNLLCNLIQLITHMDMGTLDFARDAGFLSLLETDVEVSHAG